MAAPDRTPLRRDAIIASTRDIISTDGLEALTLRRLAGRLGVTAPALYGHVTDKEDLLRSIATEEFDRLRTRFEAIDETDPIGRIRAYNRAYVAQARENPELFRLMFRFPADLGLSGAAPEELELRSATRAFEAAAGAVAEAIESGAIQAEDPLLVALTLWSGVHGVIGVLQLGFTLPTEFEDTMVDEITDRILLGYGASIP